LPAYVVFIVTNKREVVVKKKIIGILIAVAVLGVVAFQVARRSPRPVLWTT
jgi:hypothetical protein